MFFSLPLRPPPTSTLFPYTTLFRSITSRLFMTLNLPEIDQAAPQFTALNQKEEQVSLKDLAGKKVVLYFYPKAMTRSEEHTSELQSRPHLVCRLLLEKKKK